MDKRVGFLLALSLLSAGGAQAQFAKDGVRLYKQIPLNQMPTSPIDGAGCTGWVSPAGREYGIMGVRNGTIIVDVTNPALPSLLTHIPGPSSLWHENVALNGYGYFVVDSNANGMQIVDLRNLDSLRTATLVSTYTGNGLSNVHTIQANPASNTLYLNGSNRGLVFLDVTNPVAPMEVGRWTGKYVHDSFATIYPDGREIVFACCASQGLTILDVTNKATPVVLGSQRYIANGGYCHSGVLTPDRKYFLVNDELDERNGVVTKCTTHIINVEDLTNPTYVGTFTNNQNIIDHNSRWRDNYLLLAAYKGGLRIYDASNPLAMKEVGFFDTYNGSDFNFNGAWGSYIFPSGNAMIADIDGGFFTVDPSEAMGLGAPYLSFIVDTGGFDSGTTGNMRKSDDVYFVLNGGAASATRQSGGSAAVFVAETSRAAGTLVDLTLEAKVENTSKSPATVYLKNVLSGEWVAVGTWILTGGETSQTILNLPASSYVGANGRIEMRFQTQPAGRVIGGVFRVYIDQLKLTVHN